MTSAEAEEFNGREYVQFTESGDQWFEIYQGDTFRVVGTEIFVYFTTGSTTSQIDSLNQLLEGETIKVNALGTYLIQSTGSPEPDPLDFMESYLNSSLVVKGSNNVRAYFSMPNDPGVTEEVDYIQRYLLKPEDDLFDNTINPEPAWELTTGSPSVKVGVLDSGLLFQHSEIRENVWQNLDEDADEDGHTMEFVNGQWVLDPGDLNDDDDDGNGYADDLIGYNVSVVYGAPEHIGDAEAFEYETEHGTPVSGIICARSNNGSQYSGIAGGWDEENGASIVFCKMGPNPDQAEVIDGLVYLIRGAEVDIINMSFGVAWHQDIEDLLEEAFDDGIFMAGASGNADSDEVDYPSSHPVVISVGASADNERMSLGGGIGANFGLLLDITAPSWLTVANGGAQNTRIIYCPHVYTDNNGWEYELDPEYPPDPQFGVPWFGGTSGSTPMVSGVAALLLSQESTLTPQNLFEILCITATKIDEGQIGFQLFVDYPYGTWNEEVGYGQLNMGNAVVYGQHQSRALNANTWHWISSRVIPYYTAENGLDDENGIFLMFDEVANELYQLKNGDGQFWYPAQEFCNIPSWDYKQGYLIKLNAAGTVVWLGKQAEPDDPIELPAGWSTVAYLPNFTLDEHDGFESLTATNNLDIAKDEHGHFYKPSFQYSNMEDLAPGMGYQVKVFDADELVYPSAQPVGRSDSQGNTKCVASNPAHFSFPRTDDFYPIIITSIAAENFDISEGDEVGVFNGANTCIGASVVDGDFPIGLAVWRDDTTTLDVDGYRAPETFFFRYWCTSQNEDYGLDSVNVFGDNIDAEIPSSIAIDLAFSDEGVSIPTAFAVLGNFPNPFNSSTAFLFALPDIGDLKIEIYDPLGRIISKSIHPNRQSGYLSWIWAGRNFYGMRVTSGIYFCVATFRSQKGQISEVRSKLTVLR